MAQMTIANSRQTEFPEVMDIRLASKYLGVAPDTMYKYANDGNIPAFKLGNRWRFRKSSLDEWMTKLERQAVYLENLK